MSKKMIWGLATLILLIITATVWKVLHDRAYIKRLEQAVVEQPKQRNLENKVTVIVPPTKQAAPKGHVHEDGTFHEGEHPAPVETKPTARDYTPVEVQIPQGVVDSDRLAAWERVEYIANNIWEWGGVPSDENTELIAQLMPPPDGFSGASGHRDAEETINLLGRLDRNDPRSAEVMATYYCEGRVGGLGPSMALAEMGLPAVPYLLNYLFTTDGNAEAVSALGKLAVKHRKDLGGIVDHIIIPKLEWIVTEKDSEYVDDYTAAVYFAKEALTNLK